MVKLSIELSEFNLDFIPQKAIKAQTLVYFMAECTIFANSTPLTLPPTEVSSSEISYTPILPTSATRETRNFT